ncbi:hypothetical protein KFE25_007528 [Diacronema lutheri]|uniref:Uracil-DNA glycosylase n=1 Tax=Diacronema lutheri TaxID=2081491 RepID=A0A8J6CGE3_DIALT|nr:hypothetical protein KFE25_007528 [Diacronema lutheri]
MPQTALTSFLTGKRKLEEPVEEADAGALPAPALTLARAAPAPAPDGFLRLAHADWGAALAADARAPYFQQLAAFVKARRASGAVYPPAEHVFAALDACPLEQVKVVIVGQDPYHGPRQAHGLAFSIADTSSCKFPPSLRNIFQECDADPGVDFRRGTACASGSSGSLLAWATQGVLLLNTVLTVDGGKPNSHQKQGWERFTDAVVRAVLARKGKGCVFLLWGLPAAKKCPSIDRTRHRVITSSHPSPLSNTKGGEPFTGSRCFSRCNALLAELGHTPIDWNV